LTIEVEPIPSLHFLHRKILTLVKALLRFADESFMTPEAEQWLAFQVATTYGLDKAPMLERLEWVTNNTTLITNVATDPN